ncbi:NAD(P)-binding protein [Viridothelium virens]|uniref:NAD(P)-binding protein n=1 Tax=Viridothelium virens TaxID=1048519 RepID=A0A6A6GUV2_VIRVR|nr:NAD(P)-binding protein [Viridothelium virens]
MSSGKNVFIIGPGFIGWCVLDLLVSEGYSVSGLVRRKEHADGIQQSGATAVMGSLDDKSLITEHTAKNDITIHTATADHLPSVEAVLEGVRQRVRNGRNAIFIHTSGTSILDDGANGEYKGDRIYYDNKPEEIDALDDNAPHRQVDLAIVRSRKELGSQAKMVIMTPPEIYGWNPKHRRLTIQFPVLSRFAIKHGYAGHVGKGLSVESQIHVLDLARAYIVLLHWLEKTAPEEVQKNPYFFCENGKEFSWREGAEELGKALFEAGKIDSPEPRTIPEDLYKDLFGDFTSAVIGLNSRSRAVRLREMGWEPREKGIWESFRQDELPAILAEDHSNFSGYKGTVAS